MAVEGYDLVMIGLLAVAALLGYFKGMVWQLAWIAGIVVSSFVSRRACVLSSRVVRGVASEFRVLLDPLF